MMAPSFWLWVGLPLVVTFQLGPMAQSGLPRCLAFPSLTMVQAALPEADRHSGASSCSLSSS